MSTFAVLTMIAVGFAAALLVRGSGLLKVCAVCAGVSLTWSLLLLLGIRGVDVDPVLTAVLMGQSVVGIMYLAARKLPERLHVFTLPYIVTGTLVAYALLDAPGSRTPAAVGFAAGSWVLFGAVYAFRKGARGRVIAERLIECCKNW